MESLTINLTTSSRFTSRRWTSALWSLGRQSVPLLPRVSGNLPLKWLWRLFTSQVSPVWALPKVSPVLMKLSTTLRILPLPSLPSICQVTPKRMQSEWKTTFKKWYWVKFCTLFNKFMASVSAHCVWLSAKRPSKTFSSPSTLTCSKILLTLRWNPELKNRKFLILIQFQSSQQQKLTWCLRWKL